MCRRPAFSFIWLAIASIGGFYGCGDDDSTAPPPPDPPRPATVTVSPATAQLTAVGATVQLAAEVRASTGQVMGGAAVTWASSSMAVATVNASGLVTAAGNGTATITATAGTVSGSATVTVSQQVSAVAVTPAADTLVAGDTLRLSAEAGDANGNAVAGAQFSWSTSDSAVAVVDSTGLVTAVDEGAATITANSGDAQGSAEITVLEADRGALTALYHATDGPNWVDSDNWLTDAPLADWYGVATDSTGRVTGLELPGELTAQGWISHGLRGAIPPEIGRLDMLEFLFLYGNDISGPLPPEIGNLRRLRGVSLAANAISGPIPPEIGDLTNLSTLSLSDNALAGPIPSELGNLVGLWVLTLDANGLSGPIPPELGSLTNLSTLWLSNNALSGPIPRELGDLVALEQLRFQENNLTGLIPPELGNLDSLRVLWLQGNGLTGSIPSELGNLSDLTDLRLTSNELTGSIPSSLGNLSALQVLWLDDNQLTGPIPSELGKLTNLWRLDLLDNELSGPIPPQLGNLTNLTSLLLQRNELTGSIPPELGDLRSLSHLYLQENELTGPIPPALGSLSSLQQLSLSDNKLTGPIPPELGDLSSLTDLYLYDNELTGPIPAAFGHLTGLKILVLAENELTGPIPPELGGLANLTHLYLNTNNLTGPIPAELGELTALSQLWLSYNAGLTGALPGELAALTGLRAFMAASTDLCMSSDERLLAWAEGIPRRRIARCADWERPMAYLTQAVQSREFPVPLVADKQALLRVFPTARRATTETIPEVRARFYLDGEETHVTDIPAKSAPIPTGVDEGDLSRSANAVIPGRLVQPGLELVIEIDPGGTLDPELGVPKRIPETGRLPVDVLAMPKLDLTLIPFIFLDEADSSMVHLVRDIAADPADHSMLEYARLLLPIDALEVTAHEPVLTSARGASELLNETAIIRIMEGRSGHYMGMMPRAPGARRRLSYTPGRSSVSTAVPRLVASNLGANMSMSNAPCGTTRNPDPAFPYRDGSIGAWGYDFRGDGSLVPPTAAGFRSECAPPFWVSDYNFSNAARWRASSYDNETLLDRGPRTRTILVSGGLDVGGTPVLEPAFVANAPASLPEGPGDYQLTGRAADGTELFSLSFDMPEVDGGGGSTFAFAVPVQWSWAGTLDRITLSGPGGSVTLGADGDHATAILRDPRTGQVRGILRDIPVGDAMEMDAMAIPGAGAGLEVLLSRGIPDAAAWRR